MGASDSAGVFAKRHQQEPLDGYPVTFGKALRQLLFCSLGADSRQRQGHILPVGQSPAMIHLNGMGDFQNFGGLQPLEGLDRSGSAYIIQKVSPEKIV